MKCDTTGLYSLPGCGERIARRVAEGDWLGVAREVCAPTPRIIPADIPEMPDPARTMEPTMDMRAIQKTRAEARLALEIQMTDELNRTVQRLPEAHLFPHDQTARDVALGVAMRAFASPLAEQQRKALSLIRQAEFITDPEEEADIYGELEMIFYGLKRDAEARAGECDPVTGRRA